MIQLLEPKKIVFDVPGTPTVLPHRLTCYEWGNPSASHIVFCVHGLTRNGRDFDFLATALANDFRVISPDMPGRGSSDWFLDSGSYSYPTYMADCVWLLNALQLRQVHWVGTSMGGIIGMMLLPSIPGRILSMTLNDVGSLVPAAGLQRIATYIGGQTTFATREEAEAALRKNCATFGITEEAHWQDLFAHSIQPVSGKFRLAYDPAIARAFPKKEDIKDVDLWPFFEMLKTVPTLVIRGAESDILPKQVARQMQDQHARFTLHEVPNCGHAPSLMADAETSLIHKWLRGVVKI